MDIDIEAAGSAHTEIQTRGVHLNRLVRTAALHRAREYRRQFPGFVRNLTIRLFGVGDPVTGLDKGCLVCAELAPGRSLVVGSDINGDARRALHSAFTKLERGTRASLLSRSRRIATAQVSRVRSAASPALAAARA